jgi:glutamate synthase (ferredoxin)
VFVMFVEQDKTGSAKGKYVLENWDKVIPHFWQLVPPSEELTPEAKAGSDDKPIERLVAQAA